MEQWENMNWADSKAYFVNKTTNWMHTYQLNCQGSGEMGDANPLENQGNIWLWCFEAKYNALQCIIMLGR